MDFQNAFVPNSGSNMDFDMAFAGEITAGVKIGSVRAELEVALRSASEDDYEVFNGTLPSIPMVAPNGIPMEIDTSTSVQHNSYLVNLYYDFDLSNSNWTPYVGAGIGVGTYKQKATVDIDLPDNIASIAAGLGIPVGEMVVADDTLTEFEWQVGLGTIYNFTENWAMDIGYRFNSSSVSGEFVYAHEIKVGVQYTF